MPRDPNIAYVLLRNSVFGPRGAASVELCVRDLIRTSRYSGSTFVVCPEVDEPFEGIPIATVPRVVAGGNLAKAWAVGRLLRKRGVDAAIVENHLPAAALIAAASGAATILHSHAYEKPASGPLKRLVRNAEIGGLAGLAFVSRDCANRFRLNFPRAGAPVAVVPNGLDMAAWSSGPKQNMILMVGRALDDKGHVEAARAIARLLPSRPGWMARFILSAVDREPATVEALRSAAAAMQGRVAVDANVPYAEVKAAWEKAAIGLVLTKTPEPFGRTALEAMASGTALITSGLGGLEEICGAAAVTVDPSDQERLTGALASLMDSPELRAKLAREGRQRVEARFEMRAVAKGMDDFIDEALAKGGRRRRAQAV